MNLNELADRVHRANIKWWQNIDTGEPLNRNKYELLALAISEVSECLEGERKGLYDNHLPNRRMAEVEMADTKIRLLDYSAGFGIHLPDPIGGWALPDNKGQVLFEIMKCITEIDGPYPGHMIVAAIELIAAYSEKHGYDLDGAFEEKMAYNATREDHTHEARKIAGGKQF